MYFFKSKDFENLYSSRAFHVIKKLERTKKESKEINPRFLPYSTINEYHLTFKISGLLAKKTCPKKIPIKPRNLNEFNSLKYITLSLPLTNIN